jgi:hypothetical protein
MTQPGFSVHYKPPKTRAQRKPNCVAICGAGPFSTPASDTIIPETFVRDQMDQRLAAISGTTTQIPSEPISPVPAVMRRTQKLGAFPSLPPPCSADCLEGVSDYSDTNL